MDVKGGEAGIEEAAKKEEPLFHDQAVQNFTVKKSMKLGTSRPLSEEYFSTKDVDDTPKRNRNFSYPLISFLRSMSAPPLRAEIQ